MLYGVKRPTRSDVFRTSNTLKNTGPTISERFFWSDSNTVLFWLCTNSRNFKQFVMHRIGEILDESKCSEWRYDPTTENLADDAMKCKSKFLFDMDDIWFLEPDFLKKSGNEWPTKKFLCTKDTTEFQNGAE